MSLPAATTGPESLTALPDGTLILAALSRSGAATSGGIYLLSAGRDAVAAGPAVRPVG